MRCTGGVFGGRAIELSGIIVDPSIQAKGLGTAMLQSYMKERSAIEYVTAYSRNPSIPSLMQACYEQTFPLYVDDSLRAVSLEMPGAQDIDGVTYHVNRYGDDGLYGVNDPADRSLRNEEMPFKEKYTGLSHPGTALVIVSRALSGLRNEES